MKAQVLRDNQMSSFMVGKKKMQINQIIPSWLNLRRNSLQTHRTVRLKIWSGFFSKLLSSPQAFHLKTQLLSVHEFISSSSLDCVLTTSKTTKKKMKKLLKIFQIWTTWTNQQWKKSIKRAYDSLERIA